jgi:protein-disulfide isomerase
MRRHRSNTLEVVVSLAILVAVSVFLWRQYSLWNINDVPEPPIEDVSGQIITKDSLSNVMGRSDVALVEFVDFQCPICAEHFRTTYPKIRDELVAPGKVQYVSLNYPLTQIHPLAFRASEAAECAAAQNRYWEMHDRLFADNAALDESSLIAHSDAIGLDRGQFQTCLKGQAAAKVLSDLLEGNRLGVSGTPSIFLGMVDGDGSIRLLKHIRGAAEFQTLRREIDDIRKRLAR